MADRPNPLWQKLLKYADERNAAIANEAAATARLRPIVVELHESGVAQVDLVKATGLTRETVRVWCLTPEQAEAEREKRRERTRKA